jgi:hypothetical protein
MQAMASTTQVQFEPLLLPSHAVNLKSYKPEYHMDLGDVTFGSLQAQNFVKKLLL